MISVSDRLRGMLNPKAAPSANPAAPFTPTRPAPGPAAPASLEPTLGGEWRSGGSGRYFVVEQRTDAEALHGHVRVRDHAARVAGGIHCAPVLMRGAPVQPPLVFFDLETTGLSGGAGTYAFLVGCGWFSTDCAFMTRQYFLADCGDERVMLDAIAADLRRAGALVSFNGKSFDAPLLETRYLFHRLAWFGRDVPHLDVLHPARRFWSGGDDGDSSCSLGALERKILGAARVEDVPGSEIPGRYFQFVRSGDARPLRGVLEHNRLDLLSLAALTGRLLDLVEKGCANTNDTREALALGHVYAGSGLEAPARDAFRRAVTLSAPTGSTPSLRIAALRALAVAERRARGYQDAADCWQQLLDHPGCPPHIVMEAATALAIHHEHRVRDLTMARAFALRSVKGEAPRAGNDAVRHRLARIDRKLGSVSERAPLFPSSSSPPSCGSPMSARRTSS